jgi:hypothetical protein
MSDKRYSQLIITEAKDAQVAAVIRTVSEMTLRKQVNAAAVLVACSEILAQSIVKADPSIAPEFRAAIIELIDSFTKRREAF